ncbi:hypothetical protein TNCV_2122951 [Trichonephila clavipes]|nr:hypothetical protein TNCV_2122951 [Trichonephila clavipes]
MFLRVQVPERLIWGIPSNGVILRSLPPHTKQPDPLLNFKILATLSSLTSDSNLRGTKVVSLKTDVADAREFRLLAWCGSLEREGANSGVVLVTTQNYEVRYQ